MWRLAGAVLLLIAGAQGCGSTVAGDQPISATQVSLHVEGMMCAESCAKSVEKILASQPGVEEVVVDFQQKQATCKIDPQAFDANVAMAELADQDFVATIQQ